MKFKFFYLGLFLIIFSLNSYAQEITMFQGFFNMEYYQDNERISKDQVVSLISQDAHAYADWQKSKRHTTYAILAFGAEVGFMVWYLNRIDKNENYTAPLIGTVLTAITSVGFSLSALNKKKHSILKYNHTKDTGAILNFGSTYNGLGTVISF